MVQVAPPWDVVGSSVDLRKGRVEITLAFDPEEQPRCPRCGASCPIYDGRPKRWRHYDVFQFEVYLSARVPRVQCPGHGVVQLHVPWARARSSFTREAEALLATLASEVSVLALSRRLGSSWHRVRGAIRRAPREPASLANARRDADPRKQSEAR